MKKNKYSVKEVDESEAYEDFEELREPESRAERYRLQYDRMMTHSLKPNFFFEGATLGKVNKVVLKERKK